MFGPPKGDAAERILCYGGSDTGKTRAALMIAKRLQDSGSPGQLWVIDTDNAWGRMLSSREFRNLENVTVNLARRWTEYRSLTDEYLSKATPNDWLVCDFYGTGWQATQSWYIETVVEQDVGEFWVERAREKLTDKRKADAKRGGFEGRDQWQFINKEFFAWRDDILWAPCNVYATCVADAIQDTDARSLKEYCREVGIKPKGQKETVHAFHTVLAFTKEAKDERVFHTVRDRERRRVEGKKIGDFSVSYLENIALWSDPGEDDDDEG